MDNDEFWAKFCCPHCACSVDVFSFSLSCIHARSINVVKDENRNFIFEECNLCFGSLSVEAVVLTFFASMLFWSCNVFSYHKLQCQNSTYQSIEIFLWNYSWLSFNINCNV